MGASCLGLADESNGSDVRSGRTRTSPELEVEGEVEKAKEGSLHQDLIGRVIYRGNLL